MSVRDTKKKSISFKLQKPIVEWCEKLFLFPFKIFQKYLRKFKFKLLSFYRSIFKLDFLKDIWVTSISWSSLCAAFKWLIFNFIHWMARLYWVKINFKNQMCSLWLTFFATNKLRRFFSHFYGRRVRERKDSSNFITADAWIGVSMDFILDLLRLKLKMLTVQWFFRLKQFNGDIELLELI